MSRNALRVRKISPARGDYTGGLHQCSLGGRMPHNVQMILLPVLMKLPNYGKTDFKSAAR